MIGTDDGGECLYNVTELGELCGYGRDAVRARIKALGVMPVTKNAQGHGLYRAADVLMLLPANEESDVETNPSRMAPKDRKDWFDSEKGRVHITRVGSNLMLVDNGGSNRQSD